MSTEYDQAQDELSEFLDSTFSDKNPAPTVGSTQPTTSAQVDTDDVDINDYLSGADDDESQTQPAPPTTVAPQETAQPTQQQQRTEDARLSELQRELGAARARAEMFEKAIQAQFAQQSVPAEPEKPNAPFELGEIDARYTEAYGDADPFIQHIAKQAVNQYHEKYVKPLQQELARVNQYMSTQEQVNYAQHTNAVELQVRALHPDLSEIASSAEWQSFIKQADIYGGTRTLASYVQEGIKSGNVKQISAIIDQFKATRKQAEPQQQQVAPGRAQGTVPNTAPVKGKKLRMSSFNKATQDFQAGRLSYDKYQQITDQFLLAEIEGRVIND